MTNIYTAEQLASLLNGREYCSEITKEEEAIAKLSNLVIAFGASDDLLELRGAIHDEFGAYDGNTVFIFNGKVIDKDDYEDDKEILSKYGIDLKPSHTIKAEWQPEGLDASWLITCEGGIYFDILEDGALYAKNPLTGIRILLSNVKKRIPK